MGAETCPRCGAPVAYDWEQERQDGVLLLRRQLEVVHRCRPEAAARVCAHCGRPEAFWDEPCEAVAGYHVAV